MYNMQQSLEKSIKYVHLSMGIITDHYTKTKNSHKPEKLFFKRYIEWKNEDNQKYYVAEGNRRLVALKLLRMPQKAPKSIRSFIRKASSISVSEISNGQTRIR